MALKRVGWTLAFLGLLVPTASSAAEPTADPQAREKARAKLGEAAQRLQAGDYLNALAMFEQAYAIYPSPKIYYNVGLANEGLKRWGAAFRSFERFLRLSQDPQPDHAAHSRERLEGLSSRVAFVMLSCDALNAEVRLDGELVGRTPLPGRLAVDTGPHEIVVARPDRGIQTHRFTAIARQSIDLKIELPGAPQNRSDSKAAAGSNSAARAAPSEVSDAQEPPPRSDGEPTESGFRWSTWRVAGTVLAGMGVAAAVTGFVLLRNANQDCEQAKAQGLSCVNPGRERLPGYVFLTAGGAAVVGGVSLWLLDKNFQVAIGPSSVAITLGGSL